MTRILIIGAGRSAVSLIDYLVEQAPALDWFITVADMDEQLALSRTNGRERTKAIAFDIRNDDQRRHLISESDFVVSMLPAFMHGDVARDCVVMGKHMATASYVSAEMKALHDEAVKKRLLLLNECGLDPGIDHASAMKIIQAIQRKGGHVLDFYSYCGGLVAPASNDNPWGYKFSWNPRNVVVAGQSTAQYIEQGKLCFIPYSRIFEQTTTVTVEGYASFDAYANRDSLSYVDVYQLKGVRTLLRGTLRQLGYCKAWNVLVKLGWTDDGSKIADTRGMTLQQWLEASLPPGEGDLRKRLEQFAGNAWDDRLAAMMDYLEVFSNNPVPLTSGTPAQLLQALLEKKWLLQPGDRDLVVMQHQFVYTLPETGLTEHHLTSSLVLEGRDSIHTAMALTVGLPLAIAVKLFLTGAIKLSGVQIPIRPEIYNPMLAELAQHGITFKEQGELVD
jgi:saccharopine dehydrogenase (NADP+, L-glutamate forming)